jgi:hypothetical protein
MGLMQYAQSSGAAGREGRAVLGAKEGRSQALDPLAAKAMREGCKKTRRQASALLGYYYKILKQVRTLPGPKLWSGEDDRGLP